MLLPEWEIVTESEPVAEELRERKLEKSEEEKLSEYQRLVQDGQAGTLHGTYNNLQLSLDLIKLKFYIL